MTEDVHTRARQLALDTAMGELPVEESVWLTRHLSECDACRKQQEGLAATVTVLRSATVTAPPFLAARTRAGVHSHAAQMLKSHERRMTILLALGFDLVWTALIVGLTMGTASWFGYRGDMRWWVIGMISWLWLLPAIGVMVIVSLRKSGVAPRLATWNGLALGGDARD
jgi:predicted anti-sigma-YlaC factor YlaD